MTLCDTAQYVHYLSPTEGGRQHDKRLADDYPLHLPAGCVLRQDLGLLGHAPAGVVVEMPHKKPPKQELTFSQKLYNQLLSPLRVVIVRWSRLGAQKQDVYFLSHERRKEPQAAG